MLKNNEYQCAHCGEIYEKGWSDEESLKEAEETFGKPVAEWKSPPAVICDDCYNKMHPSSHPDQLKKAKENI